MEVFNDTLIPKDIFLLGYFWRDFGRIFVLQVGVRYEIKYVIKNLKYVIFLDINSFGTVETFSNKWLKSFTYRFIKYMLLLFCIIIYNALDIGKIYILYYYYLNPIHMRRNINAKQ